MNIIHRNGVFSAYSTLGAGLQEGLKTYSPWILSIVAEILNSSSISWHELLLPYE
jgi:hypothetical protein